MFVIHLSVSKLMVVAVVAVAVAVAAAGAFGPCNHSHRL